MQLIQIGNMYININHVVAFRYEEGNFFLQLTNMSLQKIEGSKKELDELFEFLIGLATTFADLKMSKA
jgi:hypothetical protein